MSTNPGTHTSNSVAALHCLRGLKLVLIVASAMLLDSCASSAGTDGGSYGRSSIGASRIQACRSGDQSISSSSSCLDGDAACYQVTDGSWCTGDRGNTCPSGSFALAAGESCPSGARCFATSANLTCAIGSS